MKKKNLTWVKFNRWTVIWEWASIMRNKKNWKPNPIRVLKCQCDCWTIKEVRHCNLSSWTSKSCWCHHKEICKWLMEELHKTQKWSWNPNWKWWIAYHNKKEKSKIRISYPYREWVQKIKLQSDFKCEVCWSKKFLQAHHLRNFSDNIELRFDINNWCTMCKYCHNNFHLKYSYYNNTPEQFNDFIYGSKENNKF